jgi:sec-independent protein translocase protein TatC
VTETIRRATGSADDGGRMPLVEHLRELRRRLFVSVLAVLIMAVVTWFFYDRIIGWMTTPYCHIPQVRRQSIGGSCNLIVSTVLAPLMLQLQVSAIGGVLLASPVWLYQIWGFVTPGLHRNERRWTITFVAASVPLFAGGAALAYLILPKGLTLLLGFVPSHVTALIQVDVYLRFVIRMMLVFGLAFELPVFVVLLNAVGVVSAKNLRKHRSMVIFLIFVFAAIATPTGDPFNMTLLAVPMVVLYEVATFIAWLHDRRKRRNSVDDVDYDSLSDDETSPLLDRPSSIERPSSIDDIP